jgi:hypothetical protein
MGRNLLPRIRIGGKNLSVRPSIFAPILCRGIATLSIGRFCNDESPVNQLSKACAAKMPIKSRIVVPELPQSSGSSLCFKLAPPTPCTMIDGVPMPSICTPNCCKQRAVLRTSSATRQFSTLVSPVAIAPSKSARCEMDLSPGTEKAPRSFAFPRTINFISHHRRETSISASKSLTIVAPTTTQGHHRFRQTGFVDWYRKLLPDLPRVMETLESLMG